jgi:hypothetical protein
VSPFAQPLIGIKKPLDEGADVVRHKLPRLEALEDLERGFR